MIEYGLDDRSSNTRQAYFLPSQSLCTDRLSGTASLLHTDRRGVLSLTINWPEREDRPYLHLGIHGALLQLRSYGRDFK